MTLIQDIAIDHIDVGENVRVDPGELMAMANSIRQHGVLQPIKVAAQFDGRYDLIFGQRRLLASREAGLDTIPAMVVAPDASLARGGARRSVEQLVENIQRTDLNALEQAIALRDVLASHKGLTQGALALQLGRTGAWVSLSLKLLDTAPAVQEYVRQGRLVAATALALSALPIARQAAVARWAVKDRWSAQETERRVSRILRPPVKRASRGRPRIIEMPSGEERSRSVVIPLIAGNSRGRMTIGVEGSGFVDIVVESETGQRVMLTMKASDAKLVSRRLLQAVQAVSVAPGPRRAVGE